MRKYTFALALSCLVVVAWLALRGTSPRAAEGEQPPVQKWEYYSIAIDGFGPSTLHDLNDLGDKGWEICASVGNPNIKALFFKRPKS